MNEPIPRPVTDGRQAVFSRSAAWAVGFAVFTVLALLNFGYRYLDDLARGHPGTMGMRLLEELTGVYTAAVLFPVVVRVTRRLSFRRLRWYWAVPLHLAAMVLFAAAHTTLMALSRALAAPLAGHGPYDYGDMLYRYPMESMGQATVYWTWVGAIALFDFHRESRGRQLATADLEKRLAEAKLENLRLQLHPHFLFNALNTVSSLMYDDVERADAMLARLSDLLRRTLRRGPSQEVALDEELSTTQLYVDMMRARFGDDLQIHLAVDAGASRAVVPQLILQPLVENSVRHGADPATGRVTIAMSVRREADDLVIELSDRGPGLRAGGGQGIGLRNTADRLAQLYGARQELRLENRPDGGLTVAMRMPFREAGA